MAVEPGTFGQHAGEQVLAEVVAFPGGNPVEHLGLQDIDAGIDGIAEDLVPARLFQKTLDAPLGVGDDHAVF